MFSKCSLGFIILGSLLLMLNRGLPEYSEPLALIGFLLLFAAAGAVFMAVMKREPGQLKVWSLSVFFVILFAIAWAEPLEIVRLLTWIKNTI